MKQWLKKLSYYEDPRQQVQHKITQNKNKRVIVSFQKHIEENINHIIQNINNIKNNIKKQQQYQENYQARSFSNLSKCVQIDDQEIDQINKKQQHYQNNQKQDLINTIKKNKENKNHIKPMNNNKSTQQQMESQTKQTHSKLNNILSDSSQQENDSPQDTQNVQASQQIIDSFISMTNLIKLIKNIPEAKGQCITLKYINNILTQSQVINKSKLNNFIINKSSQPIDSYYLRLNDKEKPYNRFVKKVKKYHHNNQETSQQNKKLTEINKFYFRTFSNGLTHQYYPVRSLIWKISSSYLPQSKQKWIWKMEISLLKYRQLIKLHIIQTFLKKKKGLQKINTEISNNSLVEKKQCGQDVMNTEKQQIVEIRKKSQTFSDPLSRLNAVKKNQKDHPLNIKQNSKWKTYFEDYQLWALIQKDTVRTRPNCAFFRQANAFSLTNDETIQNDIVKVQLQNGQKVDFRLNELNLSKSKKQCTTYIDAMSRILFIYLKVNPQQKYYQGMNELVAIIYYSLTNKNNEYFRRVSESDTYEIFTLLMTELNTYPSHIVERCKLPSFNHFISGEKYFELLKIMIRKYDFRLDEFLDKNKGYEFLKAITMRWFLSVFLSEFCLDECVILWDPIMVLIGNRLCSENNKNSIKDLRVTQFILYMSLAVIHLNRCQIYNEQLQQKRDCSKILITFQKIRQKPQEIIQKTLALYKSFPNLLQ